MRAQPTNSAPTCGIAEADWAVDSDRFVRPSGHYSFAVPPWASHRRITAAQTCTAARANGIARLSASTEPARSDCSYPKCPFHTFYARGIDPHLVIVDTRAKPAHEVAKI